MAKLKPLLPSLKEKKRYLSYEVIAKHEMQNIGKLIIREIHSFLGSLTMAKAGIIDIPVQKPNQGFIKVSNKYVNEVKASLTMIKNINQQDVIVRSLNVSGTLRKV